MPETPLQVISAFTAGRMNYDSLSQRLQALAAVDDATAQAVRRAIDGAESAGSLPFDLVAILRGLIPAPFEIAIDDADLALEGEDETFEEPTVPMSKPVSAAFVVQPAAVPDALPRPSSSPVMPPMPPSPPAYAPLPDHMSLANKVDDAVLSSLVGDYRALRQDRHAGSALGQKPDGLDGLLTSYRTARYRSDARRSSRGERVDGLDLAGLEEFRVKRAGIGSILRDRFILDREVGRGGMGVVYAAVDRRRLEAASESPYVALKLLNDDLRGNAEALRMLEAEARKSQSLAHPNIGTIYDFDRQGGEIFIVMELLQGLPLSRMLAQSVGQPLPGTVIVDLLRGLCAGLAHAHKRGVVHSDLKPGNIFVSPENDVKIIDFGLASAVHAETSAEAGLTVTYASPEMFEGAARDPRDDVFALGCIAYQLLTGLHPFGMKPINEAAAAGLRPQPIGDIDRDAWQAIDQALAFERASRLGSVEAFIAAIFDAA